MPRKVVDAPSLETWDSEQPDVAEGVPAHCRVIWRWPLKDPFQSKWLYESVMFWIAAEGKAFLCNKGRKDFSCGGTSGQEACFGYICSAFHTCTQIHYPALLLIHNGGPSVQKTRMFTKLLRYLQCEWHWNHEVLQSTAVCSLQAVLNKESALFLSNLFSNGAVSLTGVTVYSFLMWPLPQERTIISKWWGKSSKQLLAIKKKRRVSYNAISHGEICIHTLKLQWLMQLQMLLSLSRGWFPMESYSCDYQMPSLNTRGMLSTNCIAFHLSVTGMK